MTSQITYKHSLFWSIKVFIPIFYQMLHINKNVSGIRCKIFRWGFQLTVQNIFLFHRHFRLPTNRNSLVAIISWYHIVTYSHQLQIILLLCQLLNPINNYHYCYEDVNLTVYEILTSRIVLNILVLTFYIIFQLENNLLLL